MGEQEADISVAEAKRRMLEWSVETDAQMHAEVMAAVASAKQSAAKVLPWAGGAALLMGLLTGRGRRRKDGPDQDEQGGGAVHRLIGIARTAIKVGTFALPIVRSMMAKRER